MNNSVQGVSNPFVEAFAAGFGCGGDCGMNAGRNAQSQLAGVWLVRLIRMLTKAQEFSAGIDFSTFEIALGILQKCNALEEYGGAKLKLPQLG